MKHKIVINCCYGGFGLSEKAKEKYSQYNNALADPPCDHLIPRHCPILIRVVEELGNEASHFMASLKVTEIEGSQYLIEECDGLETVVTPKELNWVTIE